MAKLGFALCLLIAVCGAPSEASNPVESWIQDNVKLIQELQQKLAEQYAELVDRVSNIQSQQASAIESVVNKWKETVEGIKEASEVGRTCAASSIDLGSTGQNYLGNMTNCLKNVVEEIKSDLETIRSSIEYFASTVSGIQGEIDACQSAESGYFRCIFELFRSTKDTVEGQVNSLIKAITRLSGKLSNIQGTIAGCLARAAIDTLPAEAAQSIKEIRECVANANSQ